MEPFGALAALSAATIFFFIDFSSMGNAMERHRFVEMWKKQPTNMVYSNIDI